MMTKNSRKNKGLTLLELIVVMFLIALILSISTVFIAGRLSSGTVTATAREIVGSIRHARTLAQSSGTAQTITFDLDARLYGIDGIRTKEIPPGLNISVLDPVRGELTEDRHQIILHPLGGVEGGDVVLRDGKRSLTIRPDPVEGALITNSE